MRSFIPLLLFSTLLLTSPLHAYETLHTNWRPIQLAKDNGSSPTPLAIQHQKLVSTWAKADIDITVLPTVTFNSTYYHTILGDRKKQDEPNERFKRNRIYKKEDTVVEQFLKQTNGNKPTYNTFFLNYLTGGNAKWFIENNYAKGHSSYGNNRNFMIGGLGKVIAHEIGHSFNLNHVKDDDKRNLMRSSVKSTQLHDWQIRKARRSGLDLKLMTFKKRSLPEQPKSEFLLHEDFSSVTLTSNWSSSNPDSQPIVTDKHNTPKQWAGAPEFPTNGNYLAFTQKQEITTKLPQPASIMPPFTIGFNLYANKPANKKQNILRLHINGTKQLISIQFNSDSYVHFRHGKIGIKLHTKDQTNPLKPDQWNDIKILIFGNHTAQLIINNKKLTPVMHFNRSKKIESAITALTFEAFRDTSQFIDNLYIDAQPATPQPAQK
ncbi:hypothetical protein JD969_02435 [Planctomycetota bacterium]|nr:hypothetical protein JD969_02435 [Planctomycetota bacterium]